MSFKTATEILNAGAIDDNSKLFIVENSDYILVDGLKELTRVTIDGVEIPLEDERPMTELGKGGQPETSMVSHAMLQVSDLPGVGTVLQRSFFSNHGVWQKGSRVIVTGEWEAGAPEEFVSSKDVTTLQDENADLKARLALLEAEKAASSKAADDKAAADAASAKKKADDEAAKKAADDKAAADAAAAKKAADDKAAADAAKKAQ